MSVSGKRNLNQSQPADAHQALEAAYVQHGRMVYNICRRMLGNDQAAEDATQAVFLLVHKKSAMQRGILNMAGWLVRTSVFVAQQHQRTEHRRRRREEEASTMAKPEALFSEETWNAVRPRVDRAIAELPERYRAPLLLVYYQGQSQQDAARALKIPDGTFRWRLSEAVSQLRQRLRGDDDELTPAMLIGLLSQRLNEAIPSPTLLPSLMDAAKQISAGAESAALNASVKMYMDRGSQAMFRHTLHTVVPIVLLFLLVGSGMTYFLMSRPPDAKASASAVQNDEVHGVPSAPASMHKQTIAPAAENLDGLPIGSITISGTPKLKTSQILDMLATKPLAAFSRAQLDTDVKRLRDSGKFGEVIVVDPEKADGKVRIKLIVTEPVAELGDFASGAPEMILNQTPMPAGSRIVLYSRNRFGNYPLASYALHLGLRGDDKSVANDVNLLYGNVHREDSFRGRKVDNVPGVFGNGSAGMDGGGPDRLQVSCCGNNRNRILDLGPINYADLQSAPPELSKAGDRADVKEGHVYVVRIQDKTREEMKTAKYYKLHVIQHRDNAAVMIDWQPLTKIPASSTSEDF
jgi:RNA polymerase sigma factor (sigma-70 family)